MKVLVSAGLAAYRVPYISLLDVYEALVYSETSYKLSPPDRKRYYALKFA